MYARCLAALVLALVMLPLVGCGDKLAQVTGTVTLNSKPLESGVVTFFPASGTPVAANIDNGSYTIPAIGYGKYRITVTPVTAPPQVTTSSSGKTLKPGEVDPSAKAAPPLKATGPVIPEKYRTVDNSGLSCDVDQAKTTFPINLD